MIRLAVFVAMALACISIGIRRDMYRFSLWLAAAAEPHRASE